jgi:hypothetical protein
LEDSDTFTFDIDDRICISVVRSAAMFKRPESLAQCEVIVYLIADRTSFAGGKKTVNQENIFALPVHFIVHVPPKLMPREIQRDRLTKT